MLRCLLFLPRFQTSLSCLQHLKHLSIWPSASGFPSEPEETDGSAGPSVESRVFAGQLPSCCSTCGRDGNQHRTESVAIYRNVNAMCDVCSISLMLQVPYKEKKSKGKRGDWFLWEPVAHCPQWLLSPRARKIVPVNVIKMEILQEDSYKFKSLSLARCDAASCARLAADLMRAEKKGEKKFSATGLDSCANKSGANYPPPGSK